jgi:hypothetical protein
MCEEAEKVNIEGTTIPLTHISRLLKGKRSQKRRYIDP